MDAIFGQGYALPDDDDGFDLPTRSDFSASRRGVATALGTLSLLGTDAASAEGVAASSPREDADPPVEANFLIPTPLGLISYGAKARKRQQEECYAAGECLDKVPYYEMQCARDDKECLQRRRRLANQEVFAFASDPTSSPVLAVFAVFAFGGPLSAVSRTAGTVLRKLTSREYDDTE